MEAIGGGLLSIFALLGFILAILWIIVPFMIWGIYNRVSEIRKDVMLMSIRDSKRFDAGS